MIISMPAKITERNWVIILVLIWFSIYESFSIFLNDVKGSPLFSVAQNSLLQQIKAFGNLAFMRTLCGFSPFVTPLWGRTGCHINRLAAQTFRRGWRTIKRWRDLWHCSRGRWKAQREFMNPSAGGRQQSCQFSELSWILPSQGRSKVNRSEVWWYFYPCIYILWNHLVPLKLSKSA